MNNSVLTYSPFREVQDNVQTSAHVWKQLNGTLSKIKYSWRKLSNCLFVSLSLNCTSAKKNTFKRNTKRGNCTCCDCNLARCPLDLTYMLDSDSYYCSFDRKNSGSTFAENSLWYLFPSFMLSCLKEYEKEEQFPQQVIHMGLSTVLRQPFIFYDYIIVWCETFPVSNHQLIHTYNSKSWISWLDSSTTPEDTFL